MAVEVEGIGRLENTIVADASAASCFHVAQPKLCCSAIFHQHSRDAAGSRRCFHLQSPFLRCHMSCMTCSLIPSSAGIEAAMLRCVVVFLAPQLISTELCEGTLVAAQQEGSQPRA